MAKAKSHFSYTSTGIRALDYARSSWQRLGHLKMLCSLASPSYGTNLEGITKRFQTEVTSLQQIPQEFHTQVLEYIKLHRSGQYKRLEGVLKSIELQDFFLADPKLPAQSGALTGRLRPVSYLKTEYVEIPTWADRLKLLRKGNYTLTDRGKVLIALQPHVAKYGDQLNWDINPFLLTSGEKFLFLYSILEVDGDVIRQLYSKLVTVVNHISKADVKIYLAESFKELAEERFQYRRNVRNKGALNQFLSALKKVDNLTDQMVIPRTEPLVDCGLIVRSNPYNHVYKTTKGTLVFINNMINYDDIGEFLEASLGASIVELLCLKCRKETESILKYLARSYTQLRSGLGYCSIRELSLLTIANALNEGNVYFELSDVEKSLFDLASNYGIGIRFTKNRQGKVALVRIDRRLIEEVDDKSQL